MGQLINTYYFYKDKRKNMKSDKLIFITKDKDGNKSFHLLNPILTYYITKPEYWDNKEYCNYIKQDQVVPVQTHYCDLFTSIINSLNDSNLEKLFKNAISSGSQIHQQLQRIHLDYRLHGTDVNIQDYYIDKYLNKHDPKDNNFPLTKCSFDIEVDGSMIKGFPDPAEAEVPINIITLFDMNNLQSYSFCLNYNNDTFNKAKKSIKKIKLELKEKYKNSRYQKYLKGKNIEFHISFFDEEINLIKAFYDKINIDIKPDFVIGWNSHGFDNVYLMNRIIRLGYEPEDIMCPKEFPLKRVSYYKDTRNSDPADNSSSFSVTGYTIYIDSLNLFANLRKRFGKRDSYTLDAIGYEEIGERKDEVVGSIKDFHLRDYKKFMMYNIQDTILLGMIELKNKDLSTIYNISMVTHTRVEKAMKKTICLRNFASLLYRQQGYVISNNRAILHHHSDEKIRGALTLQAHVKLF